MPLQQNGEMHARFFGATPHAQLVDKIAQMRRDLMHIQHALNGIDHRVRANASGADMKSDFSLLYNWYLSAMESLFAMTWAAFDHNKVNEIIRDFDSKFRHFTSVRTIMPSGRPR
jgi:hypothetical protein